MTVALTVLYVICFQACAVPAVLRMRRRGSSGDLSIWREVFLIVGISAQFAVMILTGAAPEVLLSPILSATNVAILLGHILWYRSG
jgi:hypothetical protein